MNNVFLLSDGTITHEGNSIGSDPLLFLSYQVELDDAYSLRSFFKMLEKYSQYQELNGFFASLMDQYRRSEKEGCTTQEIDCLEFRKTVEMIGFPGTPRIEIYNSFSGIKDGNTIELRPFSLARLLDTLIRLGDLKHVVFGDKVDILEFDTVFNMFEFIEGVAWELSFHTTPETCEIGR